jgi:hypothetical protein
MAENKALIPFLVTMMLVTGVCNTILNKYQVCRCLNICAVSYFDLWEYIGYAMCQEL